MIPPWNAMTGHEKLLARMEESSCISLEIKSFLGERLDLSDA